MRLEFVLKLYNIPLVGFTADDGAEMDLAIHWTDEKKAHLLPLDMQPLTNNSLEKWIRHRSIPRNRAYVQNILSTLGLHANRPLSIIRASKGLSLNDSYWVTEEGFDGVFEKYNLYSNPISAILGQIAFTGYGSGSGKRLFSSPELTTNGVLPKCWRRMDGKILLYKGGTEGASNTGYEPYSEFYATQIASVLGIDVVPYSLRSWKGRICSVCELFTDKDHAFFAVGRLVKEGGINAVRDYYTNLGIRYERAFQDMLVLDAVIYNTDRHFGNMGFITDSRKNRIIASAPLFDHGNALFNYAGRDDLKDLDAFRRYAKTLLPRTYDDFVVEAKEVMTHRHKAGLRRLLNFEFRLHSRYNLEPHRLKLIEQIIRERTTELLRE